MGSHRRAEPIYHNDQMRHFYRAWADQFDTKFNSLPGFLRSSRERLFCIVDFYFGPLLFLPFLKVEKSKNGMLSPTTTRVLLTLRVKSRLLKNPRLLLKKRLILKPPSRHAPSRLLFLQGTKEKGTKLPILAPPRPAHRLPKKLVLLKKGQLATLTRMPLSARKFLLFFVA
jgi:hypothetical protein